MSEEITKNEHTHAIWEDRYKIHSYEIDTKSQVSLVAIGHYLQEAAWNHVHAIQLDFDYLIGKNQIWVLSRMLIKMEKYPKWGDTIYIQTWAKGLDRLFALREFLILGEDKAIIGRVSATWLVIDTINRRPQRLNSMSEIMTIMSEKQALKEKLGRLPPVVSNKNYSFFPVRYSDLDMNGHVNNVKYIEWVLDNYSTEIIKAYEIKAFQINYLAESTYGDEVAIQSQKLDGFGLVFLHSAVRRKDNCEIFRVRTEWKKDEKTG